MVHQTLFKLSHIFKCKKYFAVTTSKSHDMSHKQLHQIIINILKFTQYYYYQPSKGCEVYRNYYTNYDTRPATLTVLLQPSKDSDVPYKM